jgi:hypothetical protein
MTKSKDWNRALKTDILEDDYKELIITASTDPDTEVDQ